MNDEPQAFDAEKISEIISEAENLGAEALLKGDLEGAERVFSEVLSLLPQHALGHFGMGRVADGKDDVKTAERYFKEASRLAPQWIAPLTELGRIYFSQGRLNRAIRNLGKALEIEPKDTAVRYLYASALQQSGKSAEFENEIRNILLTESTHSAANNDLGCLLVQRGDLENGLKALEIASLDADFRADFKLNFANALILANKVEQAKQVFTEVVNAQPDNISALVGVATADRRSGNLEEALLNAEKAATLSPELSAIHSLVGTIYRELGQLEEADNRFNTALEVNAEDPSARTNLGLLQLLQGDWENGWQNLESRKNDPNYVLPWGGIRVPHWDGGDLTGKTILLLSEQGFGDTIQFARHVAEIAKRADKVHLAVQPELISLLRGIADNVEMVEANTELSGLDCCALLMSLPMHFGVSGPDDIDGKPYLHAPSPSDDIKAALSGAHGLKVGVNWQGNPNHKEDFKRSVAADALAPLLSLPDVSFINLNVDAKPDELPDGLLNPTAAVNDFLDGAALLGELDLVISVDTATVHLAGALGKPCWALIPFVPDWRWGLEGETTAWYESVRLYRQPEMGDWDSVIAKVSKDIQTFRQ